MKKLLAIILTVLMVFMFIPVATLTVSATDGTAYSVATADELVAAFADTTGCNVTLTADITYTTTLACKTNYRSIMDLNGHTLTFTPENGTDNAISLPNGVSYLTSFMLYNSDTENEASFVTNTTGYTFYKGTSEGSPRFNIYGPGVINMDITSNKSVTIGEAKKTTVPTINGDITVVTDFGINSGIFNGKVELTNTGATLNINDTGAVAGESLIFNGEVISAAKITINRSRTPIFNGNVTCGTTLSVASGEFNCSTVTAVTLVARNYNTTTGIFTLSANTTVNVSTAILVSGNVYGTIISDNATLSGGTYAGTDASQITGDSILALGGTFNYNPNTLENVAVKGDITDNGNGTYTVENYKPLEVNGERYTTFAEAQTAANEGDTIKVVETYYIPVNANPVFSITKNNLTIDLNGHDITDNTDIATTGTSQGFFTTKSTVTDLTVTDSTYATTGGGSIICESNDTNGNGLLYYALATGNVYNFLLEKVNIKCTGTEGNNRAIMSVSGTNTTDSTFTMKNCTMDYLNDTTGAGTGVNGFRAVSAITYNIENCNLNSNRSTIAFGTNSTVMNINNSTIHAQKGNTFNINNKVDLTVENTEIGTNYSNVSSAYCIYLANANIKDSNLIFNNCNFDKNQVYQSSAKSVALNVEFNDCDLLAPSSSATLYPSNYETMTLNRCNIVATSTTSTIGSFGYSQNVTFNDCNISAEDGITIGTQWNAINAFTVGRSSTTSLQNVVSFNNTEISGFSRFISASTVYNTVNINEVKLHKNNINQTYAANANTNIVLADGAAIYADEAMTEEVTDFVWNSTTFKTTTDLYIGVPVAGYIATITDGTDTLTTIKADEDGVLVLPTTIDGYSKTIVGYTFGDADKAVAGSSVTISDNTDFTVVGVDFQMSYGAGIRLGTVNGIRFLSNMNASDYEALLAAGFTPTEKGTTITLNGSAVVKDVVAGGFYNEDETTKTIAGSVVSIKTANLDREFKGVGYMKLSDGTNEITVRAVENNNERAVSYVAFKAYNDRSATLSDQYANITTDGDYSPYSQEKLEFVYNNYKTAAWDGYAE